MCAEAARIDAEDVVTGLEQGDACATCFDRPGQFAADSGFSWSDQTAEERTMNVDRLCEIRSLSG